MNMEGYWSGATDKASAEVEVIARAIRQMPSVKSLVERCGKAVGWQRLLYRLRLLSAPEKEAREICQPATEEGISAGDGAAPRDSSSSSRLVCVDG